MNTIRKNLELLLLIITLMSIAFLIDDNGLVFINQYGIRPRRFESIPGIVIAPFLHGTWPHLYSNIIGLVIFSGFCLTLKTRRYFLYCSAFIVAVGGLLVWCFARGAIHIGASGWVFGLWSLCIANAYYERRLSSFLVAITVIFFYGGMIYGLLPTDPRLSFEGHLFGAFAGIWAAKTFRKVR